MTEEEIIEMAKQAGWEMDDSLVLEPEIVWYISQGQLETFAKLIAQHEREACAEICDGFYLSWIDIQGRYEFMGEGASECAGAIRARGQE